MPGIKKNKNNLFSIVSHAKQDIFEVSKLYVNAKSSGCSVIIPNICNNVDLFCSDFSEEIAKKYPEVKNNYHLLGKNFLKSHPGYVQFIDVEYEPQYSRSLIIANMIAQNGVRNKNNIRPINYAYLVKSMVEVKKYCLSKFSNDNSVIINCPKFDKGSTGADWNFIKYLIQDIWSSDLKVTIYA